MQNKIDIGLTGRMRKNSKPLLVSIIFSVVLWFMVTTDKEYNYQITVPLNIVRLAKGKTLLERVPNKARLELRAGGRALIGLWFYDVAFNLDLPQVNTSRVLNLKENLHFLDLPPKLGITVVEIIEPKRLDLKVDALIAEKKPIKLTGHVDPEPGYVLLTSKLSSDSVMVSGPRMLVKSIEAIATEAVSMTNKTLSFSVKTDLVSPNPGLVNLNLDKVQVDFEIQRLAERVVYGVPVKVINVPRGLKVITNPAVLALHVKGGEKVVAELNSEQIDAEIDFNKSYKPDKKYYPVRISTPQNISWIESIPKEFQLQIKRR